LYIDPANIMLRRYKQRTRSLLLHTINAAGSLCHYIHEPLLINMLIGLLSMLMCNVAFANNFSTVLRVIKTATLVVMGASRYQDI
jgi:hypothetical protein